MHFVAEGVITFVLMSSEGSWDKNISNDKTVDGSFAIIPFTVPHGENNIYNTEFLTN